MRDYAPITSHLRSTCADGHPADRAARMQLVVDALWDAFSHVGYDWVGFYVGPGEVVTDADGSERRARTDEMLLAARRDSPACSPIGLQGVCGRAWRERTSIIVQDVTTLGNAYIACDPRDRSEIVVPLFADPSTCWGVLDIDSHQPHAFTLHDVTQLMELLTQTVRLSTHSTHNSITL